MTKTMHYMCPKCGCYKKLKECDEHVQWCIPGPTYKCTKCSFEGEKKKLLRKPCPCVMEQIALRRFMGISTRAKVSLSTNGNQAIVKTMKLPNSKHQKKCDFAIDPKGKLFQLRCTKADCAIEINVTGAKMEYLWCRRRTRKTLGLLSVSAPLDAQSFVVFDYTSKSCGIISNTNVSHLTLVEGYRLSQDKEDYSSWLKFTLDNLVSLRKALYNNPFVTIKSLHTVPRLSNKDTLLVVADISTSFIDEAAKRLIEKCALPQFPLHLAVGVCPANTAKDTLALASKQLVGLTLKVDVRFFAVLAPSLDEKFISDNIHHCAGKIRGRRQTAQNIKLLPHHDAVASAKQAANEVNQLLYNNSGWDTNI